MTDLIISFFPLIGGGAIGFGVGYLLKKLLKVAVIVIGAVALLIGYFAYQRWVTINWVNMENQTSVLMTQTGHKIYVVTQHMGHEIPIGLGIIGFIPGIILGFVKG